MWTKWLAVVGKAIVKYGPGLLAAILEARAKAKTPDEPADTSGV